MREGFAPMASAIRIDSATGSKRFATRAAKATERIAGKGYSIVTDDALKTLPELPPGATFDAQEQAKYRAFKEARRGAADYMALEGEFSKYLDDVYSADPIPREALTDDCDILVVGAGFAGLLLWHKLRAAGFEDVRFCEKGGDVGGTWYWNRYPGIACDVEAYSYLPLLEEMGYVPTMKFASGSRSSNTANGWRKNSVFMISVCFIRRLNRLSGTKRPGAGRSPRIVVMPCARGSSFWRMAFSPRRSSLASKGWKPLRAMRFTPRGGTTRSTSRTSASVSSAPAPPPCRSFRNSPRW
ncbi:MAG: NAD(P)-binding protein [Gammaproteobacteria bacterium]|nr:NAD(P)-binding protein [Gammaproteobacteria bacterium]